MDKQKTSVKVNNPPGGKEEGKAPVNQVKTSVRVQNPPGGKSSISFG